MRVTVLRSVVYGRCCYEESLFPKSCFLQIRKYTNAKIAASFLDVK